MDMSVNSMHACFGEVYWGLMERFITLPISYCALYYDFVALNVGKKEN